MLIDFYLSLYSGLTSVSRGKICDAKDPTKVGYM